MESRFWINGSHDPIQAWRTAALTRENVCPRPGGIANVSSCFKPDHGNATKLGRLGRTGRGNREDILIAEASGLDLVSEADA